MYAKLAMEARQTELELKQISEILKPGYDLDKEQPHISGERFLMTRDKLVLVGKSKKDNLRVIIKASRFKKGRDEIMQERTARIILSTLLFSKDVILFPKEILLWTDISTNYLVFITEFIEQDRVFVSYPVEEQFFTILRAFEVQEAFHATTFEHKKSVKNMFSIFTAKKYLDSFNDFIQIIQKNYPNENSNDILSEALKILEENRPLIDEYSNHLTHTDFVPHNFRTNGRKIYMLDCSSIHFGNKYEGWARFLNYMVIHNPELEQFLNEYVLKNRGTNDYLNLRLMRVYKIGYLLKYYAESLEKTTGNLNTLTLKRINFWHEVLKAVLSDTQLSKEILQDYIENRDDLRSEEEKKRQREFSVA